MLTYCIEFWVSSDGHLRFLSLSILFTKFAQRQADIQYKTKSRATEVNPPPTYPIKDLIPISLNSIIKENQTKEVFCTKTSKLEPLFLAFCCLWRERFYLFNIKTRKYYPQHNIRGRGDGKRENTASLLPPDNFSFSFFSPLEPRPRDSSLDQNTLARRN